MKNNVYWLIVLGSVTLCNAGWCPPAGAVEIRRSIAYKALDDESQLLADVYLPATPKPWPTILMIHGGAWFSGNKVHVSHHARYAAEQGFAVVAINYRLAPRYKFPAQLDDCRDALAWIDEHARAYGFDLRSVAVYGYSAGGHLASLVGLAQNSATAEVDPEVDDGASRQGPQGSRSRAVPKIRAIVAGGAPCEFSWIPAEAQTLAYWLGDSRTAVPEIYAAASPIAYVDVGDPPVFLFHGTADRIVPLQSPKKMAEQLKISQVPYQLHIMKGATHVGAFLDHTGRQKAISFLKKQLLQNQPQNE